MDDDLQPNAQIDLGEQTMDFHFFTLSSTVFSLFFKGQAYLDPGSGSFILQMLIASLVGGLFIVKTYWKKIIDFFRVRFSKNRDDVEQ